ncbi:M14 family zinc carboxypeptidase [Aliiglaciecola litoralis]|uniref:Peptidase M14 domain-containing protein n=1 Tax=Aliiglaciecola litoralis TaxID=582857 RepID=A0ABP3X0W9_9ALTE
MDSSNPCAAHFWQLYEQHKCAGLNKAQLQSDDVERCLNDIFQSSSLPMVKTVLGNSNLGKPINWVAVGKGKTPILCWSQMHGDESTATAALLDILQTINANSSEAWVTQLLNQVTLHIVPMLNPDGAHHLTRENHQGIDINRDAYQLQSPEANYLKKLLDDVHPDFAFNLHDQSRYYAVGNTGKHVVLAFMAPPGDHAETQSKHRLVAMQLIASSLKAFAPQLDGHVAKYLDGYSIKAFGDYASSQGVATILIESGEGPMDPNRQLARRLNFAVLMHSFHLIASTDLSSLQGQEGHYFDLPTNRENGLVDLIIRNLQIDSPSGPCRVDVALKYCQQHLANRIVQIGDLSGIGAFVEFNAQGAHYDEGKTFCVEQPFDLTEQAYRRLLTQGYCRFEGDIALIKQLSPWPIIQGVGHAQPSEFMRQQHQPNWLIRDEHKVIAAVLNGELVTL